MDNFMTTYRKDFKWPVGPEGKSTFSRDSEKDKVTLFGSKDDPCHTKKPDPIPQPSINPAQCGAPPVGPASKFNQPDAYLAKLYEKYPYLYNVLRMTPPQDLVKRVMKEQYLSTYQQDFGSVKEDYEEKMDIIDATTETGKDACQPGKEGVVCKKGVEGEKETCTCPKGKGLKHVQCKCAIQRQVHKIAWKPAPISKMARRPKVTKKQREKEEKTFLANIPKPAPKTTKMTSEYHDTINKVGTIIIKNKLFHKKPVED